MAREVGTHRVHHAMAKMTEAHAATLRAAIDAAERAAAAHPDAPLPAELQATLDELAGDLDRYLTTRRATLPPRPPGQ